MSLSLMVAAEAPGAGGAALDQIAIATVGATVLTLLLLWLGLGHRSGKVPYLGIIAKFAERRLSMPYWVALPTALATGSLFIAVFGMYWDIALHIGIGRDEGPLANPAHYFILFGLFGIFSAGFLAIVLPKGRPSTTAVRITKDWYAPLGGILLTACGAFALIGFPLDDVWHRIFGQDVTLWGPTHLMLIGGASMTLVGIAVLTTEGLRANAVLGRPRQHPFMQVVRGVGISGGLLIALSTFQAEFDFGVPQFRFVLGPVMLMLATGIGLTAVRIWGGRGAALAAAVMFLIIRGGLSIIVGPVLGESNAAVPLYLVEAIVIELIALRIATSRPLAFGIWSGIGIGTVGLAGEWAWSHVLSPMPWPEALAPEAIPFAFAAAISGSLVGAWMGTRMHETPQPQHPGLRRGAVLGAVGIAIAIGLGLPKPTEPGTTASVQLTDVAPKPNSIAEGGRTVQATITVNPPNAAVDAKWFTVTAWQGGGLIVDHLKEVAPGRYTTTQPIPVHGNWKSLIRLHTGRSLAGVPLFLPADDAIPVAETPALASFERPFVADYKLLQREQKAAATWLTITAYLLVAALALGLIALLVWGLHKLSRNEGPDPDDSARSTEPPKLESLLVAPVAPPQHAS